jgi:hypothetical protein
MEPKTDLEILTIYDALPSLLDIATVRAESTGGYVYGIQDDLREDYRSAGKAFRWSMPYRSVFVCQYCQHVDTQVQHELENPPMKKVDPGLYQVRLLEEDIHEIREHGVNFSIDCRNFLEGVAEDIK